MSRFQVGTAALVVAFVACSDSTKVDTALTGCDYGETVNGPGHVPCMVNSNDSVSSYASGINDSNVVVGTLDVGPFTWRGQGVSLLTHAATDPSWTITTAPEINSRGQILATADNTDGRKAHTVILTPVQS